jgi:hypothetical protein
MTEETEQIGSIENGISNIIRAVKITKVLFGVVRAIFAPIRLNMRKLRSVNNNTARIE